MLSGLMVYERFRFAPWPGCFCCILVLSNCLSPPRCIKYTLANFTTVILTLQWTSIPLRGVEILLVIPCYRNQDKLQPLVYRLKPCETNTITIISQYLPEGNWFNGLCSTSSIFISDCVFTVKKESEPRSEKRNHQ